MAQDLDAKLKAVAQIVEGRVVKDDPALPVCVKGSISGFPVTLQSINAGWPFPVMYLMETEVIEDPSKPEDELPLELTICPRFGKGLMHLISRLLLFESQGMPVGDRHMESVFVFKYNERGDAERFIKYPGISDLLLKLNNYTHFSELQVRTAAGLFLIQPKSFNALDLDVCRETFRIMAEIGQIIFEAFS